jgi:hypothetical protein
MIIVQCNWSDAKVFQHASFLEEKESANWIKWFNETISTCSSGKIVAIFKVKLKTQTNENIYSLPF